MCAYSLRPNSQTRSDATEERSSSANMLRPPYHSNSSCGHCVRRKNVANGEYHGRETNTRESTVNRVGGMQDHVRDTQMPDTSPPNEANGQCPRSQYSTFSMHFFLISPRSRSVVGIPLNADRNEGHSCDCATRPTYFAREVKTHHSAIGAAEADDGAAIGLHAFESQVFLRDSLLLHLGQVALAHLRATQQAMMASTNPGVYVLGS